MDVNDPAFEVARLKNVVWKHYGNLDKSETRARLEKYKDEGLGLDISRSY
jgi:hypothetical protein